jgi:hypothetical protein
MTDPESSENTKQDKCKKKKQQQTNWNTKEKKEVLI